MHISTCRLPYQNKDILISQFKVRKKDRIITNPTRLEIYSFVHLKCRFQHPHKNYNDINESYSNLVLEEAINNFVPINASSMKEAACWKRIDCGHHLRFFIQHILFTSKQLQEILQLEDVVKALFKNNTSKRFYQRSGISSFIKERKSKYYSTAGKRIQEIQLY